ncbi:unnamed protein product [Tenebrio molitor]|nr:unnamed protein product [Tenebrio molitor]
MPKNNGAVKKHNLHYWAIQNPHWMREQDIQNRWSLSVWGGVVNNRIVGPFFFLKFGTQLTNCLSYIPLATLRSMWLQLHGAPSHFAIPVRT